MFKNQKKWKLEDNKNDFIISSLFSIRLFFISIFTILVWPEYKVITFTLLGLTIFSVFATKVKNNRIILLSHIFTSSVWGGISAVLVSQSRYLLAFVFIIFFVLETMIGTCRFGGPSDVY